MQLPSHYDAIQPLQEALDGLDHEARRAWQLRLSKKEMSHLYALAEGQILSLDALHDAPGEVVRHYGLNSLPAFRHFEKRMVHTGERIQGYNENSIRGLIGPGHFLARDSEEVPGELWLDYVWEPDAAPADFPKVKKNTSGVSLLVYGNMIDVLRRVSAHVTVGRAYVKGKETSNYFVLCRP